MVLLRRLRRFKVNDWSMAPTFVPGETIWVRPLNPDHPTLEKGWVVVIQDPEVAGRKLLKRVESIQGPEGREGVFVVGDNSLRSRDSRHFGPVPIDRVVGVVVRGGISTTGPSAQPQAPTSGVRKIRQGSPAARSASSPRRGISH